MSGELFSYQRLDDMFKHRNESLTVEIESLGRDYLLNVSETDLCDTLSSKYELDPPTLCVEEIYAKDPEEVDVDVRHDFRRAIRDRTKPFHIKGTSITIVVPFTGDGTLFRYNPAMLSLNPPSGTVERQELHLTYSIVDHDKEVLRKNYESDLARINKYLDQIHNQVKQYNQSLRGFINQKIKWRKSKLLADSNLVESLGIPIRRRSKESLTFAPPEIRRKPGIYTPETSTGYPQPEPALPEKEYNYILKVVQDLAICMERSPRTFSKMDEESIRDVMLVILNGHYEGLATAETFNNEGKTDILIRYEGRNVFIAECKFWYGQKAFSEAIDQLLSYTTWRDTKTAVLIFNKNQDHSAVLKKANETIQEHPCFKKELGRRGETDYRYLFHQPGDKNRELHLAVLVFNVPSVE